MSNQTNQKHPIIQQKRNAVEKPALAFAEASPLYWGLRAKEFYTALRDKPIKITALDGKVYQGVLIGHDQYDLMIRQANGLTILFTKHAIKFVHEGGE